VQRFGVRVLQRLRRRHPERIGVRERADAVPERNGPSIELELSVLRVRLLAAAGASTLHDVRRRQPAVRM